MSTFQYFEGEETAVRFFNDWKEQVKSEISSDRLLVYDIRDGWDPLCKFLGVPVPDEDFPRLNDTAQHRQILTSIKTQCYIFWSLTISGLGVSLFCLSFSRSFKTLVLPS